ncbi:MAG: DNA adenine methylase, partial [Bacteroidetes bacterium]|nr:DNA adenine methylase [Bacteroidota bacterium]
MNKLRSPIRWFGGKGNMIAKIVPILEKIPHRIYVEPFGGGASILLAKKPKPIEIYNDMDSGLHDFFTVLTNSKYFKKFYRRISVLPYSREFFNEYKGEWQNEEDLVERVCKWYFIARQSFSGIFGNSWGFVVTISHRNMVSTTSRWLSIIEMLPEIHKRLQRVQIEHSDWRFIIDTYDTPETLFYCMPEEQNILLKNGISIPIKNVTENNILPNNEIVTHVQKRTGNENILYIYYIGGGNHFPIKLSLNHKIIIKRDNQYKWLKASDLCIGDRLVINTDNTVSEEYPKYHNKKTKYGKRKQSTLKMDLNNFCKLLGYYAAEGHFQDGLVFSFAVNEYEYHKEVCKLSNMLFNVEPRIYRKCPHPTSTQI